MFSTKIAPIDYSDPWKSSFSQRLKAFSRGQKRVVYFYDNPDNSTFRYRVYNMIQVLDESEQDISAAYFCLDEIDDLPKIIDLADVFVI